MFNRPRRPVDRRRPNTIRNYQLLVNRAFNLTRQQDRLSYTPYVHKIRVEPYGAGKVWSRGDYERVVALLPDYLQDFTRFAYESGWRAGAIKRLRWSDLNGDVLTLREQYSKSRRPHSLPLEGELLAIIERRRKVRKGEFVFHYNNGRPIGSYKTAWRTARRKAGRLDHRMHDFRVAAITNIDRAGVPQKAGMQLTGTTTPSIYRRYRICEDTDVRSALDRRASTKPNSSGSVPP